MPDMFGQEPEYVERFSREIQAIRIATEHSATLIPEKLAELSKQLATTLDVYKTAGEPSRGTPGPQWEGGRSGYSTLDNIDDTASQARADLARRSSRRPMDINEQYTEGLTDTNTHTGSKWQDRVQLAGLGNVLPLPRYPGAQPNAADLLNYMATVSANVAQKRQTTLDTRSQTARQQAYDNAYASSEGDFSQVPLSDLDQMSAQTPETRLGKLSNVFAAGESGYAQGKYIRGILRTITEPAQAMRSYGYQTGFEGGSPGLLGFRSPFDSAAMAGAGQRASQFGFALGQHVTPGQAGSIYNSLFANGWYGGGSTNDMRTAGAQMMRQNPYIASTQEYYDMMDKATRQGAASLSTFNAAMMQVPNVAKAAHTSIVDTMGAMDQLGQYNKTIGGTYMAGMQNAVDWQNVTGMPASVMGQLMQNPLVVGQTFAATGLMPQMQGLATPFQHTQGILGAVNLMNRAIIAPHNRSQTDPITGLTQTTSGQDQKEALMASTLGVSKEVVHNMLSNQKGWMSGMEITNSAETYQSSVIDSLRQGDLQGARQTLTGAPWQRLQGALKTATDSQGHKVFEDWNTYKELEKSKHNPFGSGTHMSESQIHKLAQGQAEYNISHAGDTKALQDMGFPSEVTGHMTRDQAHQVVQKLISSGHGTKQMLSDIARARTQEIKHYQNMNTQKFGPGNQGDNGPSLQIELGPAARKMFHLSDPNNQQKAATNAGSASLNLNSYVSGPTTAPTPNLDTAGGSPTYSYGGPSDSGSQ